MLLNADQKTTYKIFFKWCVTYHNPLRSSACNLSRLKFYWFLDFAVGWVVKRLEIRIRNINIRAPFPFLFYFLFTLGWAKLSFSLTELQFKGMLLRLCFFSHVSVKALYQIGSTFLPLHVILWEFYRFVF